MKTLLLTLIAAAIFCMPALSQENKQLLNDKWTKIVSEDAKISVELPSNFIVDAEKKDNGQQYRLIGFQNGVVMEFLAVKHDRPEITLQTIQSSVSSKNTSMFEKEGMKGLRIWSAEGADEFTESLYFADKKIYYNIKIRSPRNDKVEIDRFLYSIRIDEKPFLSSGNQQNRPENTISLNSLKSSPEVVEAFARKPEKRQFEVLRENSVPQGVKIDFEKLSRPLIILERPYPKYRPRNAGKVNNGVFTVKLKVAFLANGQIGDITVHGDSDEKLIKDCIEQARKIKFVPAQINGQNADSVDIVDYRVNTFFYLM